MLGQFVALIGRLTLGEYAYFTLMYGNSSMQKFERFALLALLAAVFGLFAFVVTEWAIEDAGVVSIVVGVLLAIVLFFIFMPAFLTYRKKFIACPKCEQETKIVKDDLLSEHVIGERKNSWHHKHEIEHHRIGKRLVTIACQSCDYTKGYELKFKEKA